MKYQIWQICETVGSARQGWLHFLKQVDAFFLWMHFFGCISTQPAEAAHLECVELYKYQIPFSQIHPRPLPSTATSASAPSARSCSVEMHWTEAAALSWTATPCKWSACLSLVHSASIVQFTVHSALQWILVSEVDGGAAVQRQSINSSKESFSEVSSFHTNMSRCPAPVKEQNFISMLKVLELFGVSMLAH